MLKGSSSASATKGFAAYAALTLAAIGLGAVVAGDDRAFLVGMVFAWFVQVLAFWPLARAVTDGQDMTRSWLGGLALRGAGLAGTVGLVLAERASSSLAIAYGGTMLVLLLLEAGWLFRRLPRPGEAEGEATGSSKRIERTSTTG